LGLRGTKLQGTGKDANEGLYDLHSSPNIIRVIESRIVSLEGQVAGMGDRRVAYRVLVGSRDGKRPLGRPRRRRECNITMDLQEV
jgi:hypothetical protein